MKDDLREQETLLRAARSLAAAVGQMNWEERANAALDLLIVSGGLAHRASGAEPWREW